MFHSLIPCISCFIVNKSHKIFCTTFLNLPAYNGVHFSEQSTRLFFSCLWKRCPVLLFTNAWFKKFLLFCGIISNNKYFLALCQLRLTSDLCPVSYSLNLPIRFAFLLSASLRRWRDCATISVHFKTCIP